MGLCIGRLLNLEQQYEDGGQVGNLFYPSSKYPSEHLEELSTVRLPY